MFSMSFSPAKRRPRRRVIDGPSATEYNTHDLASFAMTYILTNKGDLAYVSFEHSDGSRTEFFRDQ